MSNYLDGKYKTFQELMTGIPESTPVSLYTQVYDAQKRFIIETGLSPNVIFLGRLEKAHLKESLVNYRFVCNKNDKRWRFCGFKVRFSRKKSEVTPALILGAL